MLTTKKAWDLGKRNRFINQEEADIDVPDGDAIRGEKLFNASCSVCHSRDKTELMGPSLRNVYNRKALTKEWPYRRWNPDKLIGTYWTRERLFIFLDEDHGLKDSFDRACIIEYLHYLKIKT